MPSSRASSLTSHTFYCHSLVIRSLIPRIGQIPQNSDCFLQFCSVFYGTLFEVLCLNILLFNFTGFFFFNFISILNMYLLLLLSHPVVSNSLQLHGLQQPGLPVPHHLLEFAQDQVHCIGDAITHLILWRDICIYSDIYMHVISFYIHLFLLSCKFPSGQKLYPVISLILST